MGGRVKQTGSPAALIRIPVIPAKAGWTGLDPFKFFTGTVGTPDAMSARDCAMAILCRAGRLRPARLLRGGTGAAQAAEAVDMGPRTRAEGVGAQVVTVDIRALEGVGAVELGAEVMWGMVEGGRGGGTEGGGGRLEDIDRAAVAEPSRERDCPKPTLAPEVEFLCGERTRDRDGG